MPVRADPMVLMLPSSQNLDENARSNTLIPRRFVRQ